VCALIRSMVLLQTGAIT